MNGKTLTAILQEGCQKLGIVAIIDTQEIRSQTFCCTIGLESLSHRLSISGKDQSSKKQAAKHLAAGDALVKVLETPFWNKFFDSRLSIEEIKEALTIEINGLKSGEPIARVLPENEVNVAAINYIGILQTICQQRNYALPSYDIQPAPHEISMFQAVCFIPGFEKVTVFATNKKRAKNDAARKMIETLPKENSLAVIETNTSASGNFDVTDLQRLLTMIDDSLASNGPRACLDLLSLFYQKGALKVIFQKPVMLCHYAHGSKCETIIRSIHVTDKEIFEECKSVVARSLLYSVSGFGSSEMEAYNDAAKKILKFILISTVELDNE